MQAVEKAGKLYTASPEELQKQIDQFESEIRELLDYRTEVDLHKRSVKGWARFIASLKLLLVARQIERHLVYLKLQRRIARDSYDRLQKAAEQNPA
ncbi:MAG TPA: hypothetical protein VFE21_10185 [Rubrobacteraceae bacterium]|nr:hypothetical protein [Rubrobacteraceae bacterium]